MAGAAGLCLISTPKFGIVHTVVVVQLKSLTREKGLGTKLGSIGCFAGDGEMKHSLQILWILRCQEAMFLVCFARLRRH